MADEANALTELENMMQSVNTERQNSVNRISEFMTVLEEVNSDGAEIAGATEELAKTISDQAALQGDIKVASAGVDAAISNAEFENVMQASDALYNASKSATDRLLGYQDQYDATFDSVMDDLNAIQSQEEKTVFDFLKNPIESIKERFDVQNRKEALPTKMSKLDALTSAQQQVTANWQARSSTLEKQATTRQAANSALYFSRMELGNQVNIINTYREVSDAQLEVMKTRLNLTEQMAQNIRSSVAAEIQKGDISLRFISSAIQVEQLKATKEQLALAKTLRDRDEAARDSIQTKLMEANDIFGFQFANLEEFELALKNGMITPEAAYAMQSFMTAGTVGAGTVFTSDDPYTKFMQVYTAGPQSVFSPELAAIVQHVVGPIQGNAAIDSDTKEAQIKEEMQSLYLGGRQDIDNFLVPASGVINIYNPAHVDYQNLDTSVGMPLAAIDVMKSLDIRSTSWQDFSTQAIRKLSANKSTDLELAAQGLAALSKLQLQGVNNTVGFGFTSMNTPALKAGNETSGDALNPAHWLRALQSQRAAYQSQDYRVPSL